MTMWRKRRRDGNRISPPRTCPLCLPRCDASFLRCRFVVAPHVFLSVVNDLHTRPISSREAAAAGIMDGYSALPPNAPPVSFAPRNFVLRSPHKRHQRLFERNTDLAASPYSYACSAS